MIEIFTHIFVPFAIGFITGRICQENKVSPFWMGIPVAITLTSLYYYILNSI